jgi:hypothetical protein
MYYDLYAICYLGAGGLSPVLSRPATSKAGNSPLKGALRGMARRQGGARQARGCLWPAVVRRFS